MANSLAAPRVDANEGDAALTADPAAALAFLRIVAPEGPWLLTAIWLDETIVTDLLATDESVVAWIEKNGRHNLYYHVGVVPQPRRKKNGQYLKAEKEDVRRVRFLHADIDPRLGEDIAKEKERMLVALRGYTPPPTLIVDSGGGLQALWALSQPIELDGTKAAADMAAQYNRALALSLDGDKSAKDVSRILRLPGTVNWPTAVKKKKGRVAAPTRLLEHHPERLYPLDQFPQAEADNIAPLPPKSGEAAQLKSIDDIAELRGDGYAKLRALIVAGDDPDREPPYPSRSEALFAAVCGMVRAGCSDETISAALLNPDFGISNSVLDKGKRSANYVAKQIRSARAKIAAGSQDFICNADKKIVANNQHNIRVAIQKLGVRVSHDTFADRMFVDGLEGKPQRHLGDPEMARLYLLIDQKYGFRPTREFFWMVVDDDARQNSFHPVCDYLDGLTWDGTARISEWLIKCAGADDTPYTRAVSGIILIAAVRRIREPGCKFDEMLVLETPMQGLDKSSALTVLAVREGWFSDSLPLDADDKEVIEKLAGRWIIECPELDGMKKADAEHLKATLSRRIDRARPAYGRMTKEAPRQCVIFGTTNKEQYLQDATGNRRYWPVRLHRAFDLKLLKRDLDQLWAEAAHAESLGESIRLDPALYAAAAEQQKARELVDPWVGMLEAALGDHTGKIRSEDVWALVDLRGGQRTQHHNARIGDAMRALGWERTKLKFDGRNAHCYVRGSAEERGRWIKAIWDAQVGPVVWYAGDEDEAMKGNAYAEAYAKLSKDRPF